MRSATTVSSDVLKSGVEERNLKLVARAGTGVDNIDVSRATENGVLVMNAVGSNTISAAELTCAMIMNLARRLPQANMSMKEGKWERSKFQGIELFGKTLAIIGLGRIGKEVCIRMKSFGMHVIGYDPIMTAQQAADMGVEFKALDEIWPVADFITIHVPLMPETKGFINESVFNKCKKGFRIINCARGGIIDEADLVKALANGHCAGAGIDVFAEVWFDFSELFAFSSQAFLTSLTSTLFSLQEPTKNFELVNHPNVVCTPHLGASSVEAQNRVAVDIAEQIVKCVRTGVIEGGVNLTELRK